MLSGAIVIKEMDDCKRKYCRRKYPAKDNSNSTTGAVSVCADVLRESPQS